MIQKILIALLITTIQSLYLYVNHSPLCMDFYSNQNSQRFAYDVAGSNPENMNITVYDSANYILKQFASARDVALLQTTSRFKVCFNTVDNTSKAVSFDIWEDGADKIKKLASKSDILAVHSSIVQASNILKTVSQQEKFHEQRDSIYSGIIKQTQDGLQNYGVLKVIIIIGAILVQIIILKRALKSS